MHSLLAFSKSTPMFFFLQYMNSFPGDNGSSHFLYGCHKDKKLGKTSPMEEIKSDRNVNSSPIYSKEHSNKTKFRL